MRKNYNKYITGHDNCVLKPNTHCKAPTFKVCKKMASLLNLSEAEAEAFLAEAFKGRIESDIDYYNSLHHMNKKQDLIEDDTTITSPYSVSKCSYIVAWNAHLDAPKLDDDSIKPALTMAIQQALQHGQILHRLDVKSRWVELVLDIPSSIAVETSVLAIQQRSARLLESFVTDEFNLPNIWGARLTIVSTGAPSSPHQSLLETFRKNQDSLETLLNNTHDKPHE